MTRRAALLVVVALLPGGPPAARELPGSVVECLACHDDPGLTRMLGDGTELSLHVDPSAFAASVHAESLVCSDCHAGYADDHPWDLELPDHRSYALRSYELCKDCHFETYAEALDSVHAELVRAGSPLAPVCTDCHGAHDTMPPAERQAMLSRSCKRCHGAVYAEYAQSVHGRALTEEANPDVPGCADCHSSHHIESPGTPRFRLRSPEICLDCHADAERVEPYGLSTLVGPTYLTDFHGVTASLALVGDDDPREVVVTCLNCHGFHTIASPRTIGAEAMKANVAATCRSCHENASPDFPAAWLSHYPPSWRHAPWVYAASLFYKIFIPLVVGGLALQVLMHLFRVARRR